MNGALVTGQTKLELFAVTILQVSPQLAQKNHSRSLGIIDSGRTRATDISIGRKKDNKAGVIIRFF